MTAQLGDSIVLGYGPQGAQQAAESVVLSYSPPPGVQRRINTGMSAPWGAAVAQHTSLHSPMGRTSPHDVSRNAPWRKGKGLQPHTRHPWHIATKKDTGRTAPWGRYARTLSLSPRAPWGVAIQRDAQASAPWGSFARALAIDPHFLWGLSLVADLQRLMPWGEFSAHPSITASPHWATPRHADATRWIPWTRFSRALDAGWGVVVPPGGIGPDDPGVIVIVRKTYMTINNVSLRRVSDNVQVPAAAFTMSIDVDSWTWNWSASLPADALSLVMPGIDGDPIELEATINGIPYRLSAEGISRQREFVKGRVSVQGRGTAAILDAPYAPVRNHGSAVSRTAQQLMGDVLTVNGVGIGWGVDFGLTDWLVPGNVWGHQGPYISAILDIAQAAGGYVQPHATAQTLRILPRYPAAPWNWATDITPDYELPADVVSLEGISWVKKPAYSRVFVSGQSQGVLGQVTRTGTAGDVLAPMVTDALITHADAARQRGRAILSDSGRQAQVSLKLPVLAETGLILPGKFVSYVDGATTRLGLVRGMQLDLQGVKLRQTISLETHLD